MITTAIINPHHINLSIVAAFTHSMRPTSTSSTSPLSHHANKSSLHSSNLTLVSPPTSINGEDTLPQLGFGWEFELTLEERMRQKEHEIVARFQRYERFGMRLEEARLPTPDRFRMAYDELVEAINNDRTPSPSPEYVVGSNRNPRKVNGTQRHHRRKDTTKKVHNSFNYGDKSRISKQKHDKAIRPRRQKQADHVEGSSHRMITRSKTATLQRI